MARKTKEDTQATREGILDAAEACFHEHGVARTTLEMIGARAGYTRGAVYWHFKNKSEVLAAIVERVHLPFMQELERTSTDQRDTPVHDLRAVMIHSFIELSEDERLRKTMEIMLRSDASADTRVLTEMQQAGFRDALDRMERALRRARDLGQLREGADPKIAARMLHATVLGVLHGAMVEPDLMDGPQARWHARAGHDSGCLREGRRVRSRHRPRAAARGVNEAAPITAAPLQG